VSYTYHYEQVIHTLLLPAAGNEEVGVVGNVVLDSCHFRHTVRLVGNHTIANLQTLLFLESHGAKGTLVGLKYLITTVKDGFLKLPKAESGIVSVFCLGQPATGVTIRGLQYELINGEIRCDFPLGVSNHFVGKEASVSVENGTLIVMYDIEKGLYE
jgi:hypothetical protein